MKQGEFAPDSGRRRIMVVGDSHSKDVAAALLLGLGVDRYDFARMLFDDPCFSSRHTGTWMTQLVGTKTECESEIEALKSNRAIAAADYLLIANYWDDETVKGFDEGLALLRSLTKAKR